MFRHAATMLAVAAAVFVAPLSASAKTAEGKPSEIVSFNDIDLTTPDGVATLHARVRSAAKIVCKSESSLLIIARISERCLRETLAIAESSVAETVASVRSQRQAANIEVLAAPR